MSCVVPRADTGHETGTMLQWWIALAALVVLGCQRPGGAGPTVAIGALRHGLPAHLEAHRLAPDEAIRVDLVERTAGASVHIAQVRGSERPHRHVEHDLLVLVLSGRGVLTLDGTRLAMRSGDVALVERGVPHWFASDPGTLAVAVVAFMPPLDAPDSVPLDDVDSVRPRR